MTLFQMRQKYGELIAVMRGIVQREEIEGTISPKDEERFRDANEEAKALRPKIEKEERLTAWSQVDGSTTSATWDADNNNGASLRYIDQHGRVHRGYRKGDSVAAPVSTGAGFGRVPERDDGYGNMTMGSFLRAAIFGPRNDYERRALSEGTDSAGGYDVPEIVMSRWWDRLRAQSVVFESGATLVTLAGGAGDTFHMTKLATDIAPAWRNEAASVAETDPAFGRVTLTPRSLAAYTKFSRELQADAINLDQMLEATYTESFARKLDAAALFGSGSAPEPEGLVNTSNINETEMGANGAAPTSWDEVLDGLQDILDNNGPEPDAAVWAPRTRVQYAKLADTTGQPLRRPPELDGLAFRSTSAVPIDETQGTATDASSILIGGFEYLLVGVRERFNLRVLREKFADTGQLAVVGHMRADVAVVHPAAFSRVKGLIP